ncbi:MAG: hypothetical protein AAF992_05675 [Bacteroidota bacterium]
MKNKELAYDYIYKFLFEDASVDTVAPRDERFDTKDKNEIAQTLGVIKNLSIQAQKSNVLQTEQGKEVAQAQASNAIQALLFSTKNVENTYDTIISIKTSLQDVVKDARRAYNYTMLMYIAAFVIGIGLIATSIVFAAQDKTILAIAFGAVGFIDLVTTFFFKPPLEIQNSRSNLAQLMIIITNWFADSMNLNTYISTRGSAITLDEMKQISEHLGKSTEDMIKLIEKYSEIRK